jgi:HD-GYP domain-containing protein (c-di-GMP phosphodiesterase class II)
MNLIPVSIDSIHVGRPLPFHLVDKDGVLLARKAFVVRSKGDLIDIADRGGGLFIDGVDADALQRAYLDQLQTLLREDKSLGVIAGSKLSAEAATRRTATDTGRIDWFDLQEQANFMLRDKTPASFRDRLDHIHEVLTEQLRRNPDGTLFALIHLSSTETQRYSATHAMLVSVMCALASREVLKWPEPVETLLRKAALTMNIGMTDLQDKLARQPLPPTTEQRGVIDAHAATSTALLAQLGVTDNTWLEAVREHHTQTPGPLRGKTPAQRLARLMQRADMFAARLAPRASRAPISPAAAMQACYFDENKEVDEAGAALIKAVGIYQPGSFVKLATEEIAVVIRRGTNTNTPRVAVLINRSGMPTVEPTIRDTTLKDYRITASVAHRDVRVQINLEKLLPLTLGTTSDRPW